MEGIGSPSLRSRGPRYPCSTVAEIAPSLLSHCQRASCSSRGVFHALLLHFEEEQACSGAREPVLGRQEAARRCSSEVLLLHCEEEQR